MSFLDHFFKKQPIITAPLRFQNTLSGEKEAFVPLSNREVRMYNCGPTVYDFQHIGNLRPYVFADLLRRTLILWGYNVKQVINITDVCL
jgi:cysteinyl-tRNA synthetase